MPDAAWKAHERAIAVRLDGRRAGPLGKDGADVLHPLFSVECKLRRRPLPLEIRAAVAQAVAAAHPDQLPIVVWHTLGRRHDDDMVMMRLADFTQWAGELPEKQEVST